MAKMYPLEDPPSVSSSDGEEVEIGEEVNSPSEDEDENTIFSSEEDEKTIFSSEEDENTIFSSEEDEKTIFSSEEDEPSDTPIPPITIAVSMQKTEEVHSSEEAEPFSQAVKSETKRKREEISTDENSKRVKMVTAGEDEEYTRERYYRKIWSEGDEIALLHGIIDFVADTGKKPSEDGHGFYKFVKKSISFEASKTQCMSKIRKLKTKYMKKKDKGKELSFWNANEKKCFKLSDFIWGYERITLKSEKGESKKRKRSKKKEITGKEVEDDIHGGELQTESDWFEKSTLVRLCDVFYETTLHNVVREKWSKMPLESKKKLEEKWKLLNGREVISVMSEVD